MDLERSLSEIAGGLRLAAERREARADAAVLRGDMAAALAYRRGAAHARAQADDAVEGLARLHDARISSPEHCAMREETARRARADRATVARIGGAAEQRIAAGRATAKVVQFAHNDRLVPRGAA